MSESLSPNLQRHTSESLSVAKEEAPFQAVPEGMTPAVYLDEAVDALTLTAAEIDILNFDDMRSAVGELTRNDGLKARTREEQAESTLLIKSNLEITTETETLIRSHISEYRERAQAALIGMENLQRERSDLQKAIVIAMNNNEDISTLTTQLMQLKADQREQELNGEFHIATSQIHLLQAQLTSRADSMSDEKSIASHALDELENNQVKEALRVNLINQHLGDIAIKMTEINKLLSQESDDGLSMATVNYLVELKQKQQAQEIPDIQPSPGEEKVSFTLPPTPDHKPHVYEEPEKSETIQPPQPFLSNYSLVIDPKMKKAIDRQVTRKRK